MNSPVVLSNTRRNLFGIRLNHEQLIHDVTNTWKAHTELQKRQWNFDFDQLKPLGEENLETINNSSPIRQIKRFQWSPIRSQNICDLNHQGTLNFDDSDEESDDALVIPQFYQQQRVKKMQKELSQEARLKQVRLNTIAKLQGKPSGETLNVQNEKSLKRSKATKKTVNMKLTPDVIITFSENRKDTLRSALAKKSKAKSPVKSSSVDTMKQPKISNLLKQRKRILRNNNNSAVVVEAKSNKLE